MLDFRFGVVRPWFSSIRTFLLFRFAVAVATLAHSKMPRRSGVASREVVPRSRVTFMSPLLPTIDHVDK
jgi:hypothetical protein